MKVDAYFSKLPPATGVRPARSRKSLRRTITRLEGYIGPIDITQKKWDKLIKRAPTFTADDWKQIRQKGKAAIPELRKR